MLLKQPVFKSQSGNLGKVHGVLCEKKGVVGDGDAGNLEVHGADADALLAKGMEKSRCILIQRQNRPPCVGFDEVIKFRVGVDLPQRVGCGMDFLQPAFDALLNIHNGGGDFLTGGIQAPGQSFGRGSIATQCRQVVSIQHHHGPRSPFRRFGCGDTLRLLWLPPHAAWNYWPSQRLPANPSSRVITAWAAAQGAGPSRLPVLALRFQAAV